MVAISVLIKVRRRHTYTQALIDKVAVRIRVVVTPVMLPNDPTPLHPTLMHRLGRTIIDANIVVIRYDGTQVADDARVKPHALIAVTP